MAKDIQIAIRMTEEKRDALKAAAEATSRTMSGYIDFVLTQALKAEGYFPPKLAPKPTRKPKA